jgi:hypothetical protein
VPGLWVGPATGEPAKCWLTVLSELRSRSVADGCIAYRDGLTGPGLFPGPGGPNAGPDGSR